MTDTWTEITDRLNASGQPVEAQSPASETQPAPIAGPASWQPYTPPFTASTAAVAAEPAAPSAPADPLILELEHAASPRAPDPAPVQPAHPAVELASPAEPPPSVYGRVEPPLESEPAASAPGPVVPPAPVPIATHPAPAPVEAPHEPASIVAPPEKVVESALELAEPAPVIAPAPEPAPIVAAESPPERSLLSETPAPAPEFVPVSQVNPGHDAIDPVLAGFDHVVALAGYVLLFISVFMFGVPALATMALAYAHKNDSHLLVRSHYRFQLRIFWTAILFILLAIGSAVTAGGMAITILVDFARAHLPGVGAAMDQAHVGAWSGEISGLLLVAAVTLGVLAVVWTLVASVFGFLRLVGNRPIGHSYAAK